MGNGVSTVFLRDGYSLFGILSAGANTGTTVSTQLIALLGESFKPADAIVLSKVNLESVENARNGIGIVRDSAETRHNRAKYTLIDFRRRAIDRSQLREYGLGDTLGCPASMKPSSATQEFLREKGVVAPEATMLQEFVELISNDFRTTITGWYNSLTEEQKKNFLTTEAHRLLSGELHISGKCPFRSAKI